MQWCLEAADEMDQEIIRDGRLATVVATITDDLVVEEIIAASSHDVLKNKLHFRWQTSVVIAAFCPAATTLSDGCTLADII